MEAIIAKENSEELKEIIAFIETLKKDQMKEFLAFLQGAKFMEKIEAEKIA